jgi:hypothetical protein
MSSPKKHKLDIFEVLGNLGTKNRKYFPSLSEDDKKAIQPLVIMRWMSGTSQAWQIIYLNELINPLVFPLSNHKELLMDLMTTCGTGTVQRFNWKKIEKRKHAFPISLQVVQQYYQYNASDASGALPCLSNEQIMQYAEQLGVQLDIIKKLKLEFKKR